MELAYECRQDVDGTFSVHHTDNHQIALIDGIELRGLDEESANAAKDRLEVSTLDLINPPNQNSLV